MDWAVCLILKLLSFKEKKKFISSFFMKNIIFMAFVFLSIFTLNYYILLLSFFFCSYQLWNLFIRIIYWINLSFLQTISYDYWNCLNLFVVFRILHLLKMYFLRMMLSIFVFDFNATISNLLKMMTYSLFQ